MSIRFSGSLLFLLIITLVACKKEEGPSPVITFNIVSSTINGSGTTAPRGVNLTPTVIVRFDDALDQSTINGSFSINGYQGVLTIVAGDSSVSITPATALKYLTKYQVSVKTSLKSKRNVTLSNEQYIDFYTEQDLSDKFPRISDEALMDSVQRRTFAYFWEFGHPVSGLSRERNTSGDLVTSGGSGFGLMAIPVGVRRNFITRAEALERSVKIVNFLNEKADKFHGAFPHWLSGTTGKVIPFSANDNGGDLVETSYLIAGLLTIRQYFDGQSAEEIKLRADINTIWEGVEWDWYRKGQQDVLYWHWSPDKEWALNLQIRGWNEALITYILATSSPTHGIPAEVYHKGWARDGGIKNNKPAYGINLPLGNGTGGPLFFEHYVFTSIDPNGLKDSYADYSEQTKAHTLINRAYCIANPKKYYGYSSDCWGLTAGDINNGYTASSPDNDVSVITPTAALSSIPYTPEESMEAMRYFYYKLGNRLWGPMGFYDGFSLHNIWFANSTLAIDQGPIVIMIENHRSGLIWDLMMSTPEVRSGMQLLGFSSPHF